MPVRFSNNTKKENGNPRVVAPLNRSGNPRSYTTKSGRPRSARYTNTRKKQLMSYYQRENVPWIDPGLARVIRNNIRIRKQYGLPSPFANDEGPDDPVVVTAVKDPETGQWKNKICNTLTNFCFYAAIAAAVTKAKGLWGGTRRRKRRSKA